VLEQKQGRKDSPGEGENDGDDRAARSHERAIILDFRVSAPRPTVHHFPLSWSPAFG